jgi:hypothetical protein
MESAFSTTIPIPPRMRSLSNPIVRSSCGHKFAATLTSDEARRLLEEDFAATPMLEKAWTNLWFLPRCIYPNLRLRLQFFALRCSIRWPALQKLMPGLRKRAQRAALLEKAQVESGGGPSISPPMELLRRLKAYQDEYSKIEVSSPIQYFPALVRNRNLP